MEGRLLGILGFSEYSISRDITVANKMDRYKHPRLTKEEVESVIESYRRMNWWP
jgi:hypothetical protein